VDKLGSLFIFCMNTGELIASKKLTKAPIIKICAVLGRCVWQGSRGWVQPVLEQVGVMGVLGRYSLCMSRCVWQGSRVEGMGTACA